MSERAVDLALFEQMARIGQAAASARRLELLDVLAQGERCVECLAKAVQMPVNSTSNHLKVLRNANLVSARRQGTQVFYSTDPHLSGLLRQLWTVADARLSEVAQILHQNLPADHAAHQITHTDLHSRGERDDILLIDVRPEKDYRIAHLPGAASIPFDQLAQELAGLPATAQIVTYGRGPYSLAAARAAHLLRQHGHQARALTDGLPQWRAAGLPMIEAPTRIRTRAHPRASGATATRPPETRRRAGQPPHTMQLFFYSLELR